MYRYFSFDSVIKILKLYYTDYNYDQLKVGQMFQTNAVTYCGW